MCRSLADENRLVSVIIPAFNAAKTIVASIESVLAQTYRDLEIIVVDDGSTDGTAKVIEQRFDDPRLKLIAQTNAGPAAARNRGISASNGYYLAFLDSDDTYAPGKITRQVQLLSERPDVDVCYTGYWMILPGGRRMLGTQRPNFKRGDIFKALLFESFIHVPTIMAKKQDIIDAGGYWERVTLGDDWWLMLSLAQDKRFDYIDEPLYNYTVSKSSLTSNAQVKAKGLILVLDDILENKRFYRAKELSGSDIRKAYAYLYRRIAENFYSAEDYTAAALYYQRAISKAPRIIFDRQRSTLAIKILIRAITRSLKQSVNIFF